MKRLLAITAVCLVLGAVVNVLVAWGIELFDLRLPKVVCAGTGTEADPFGGWMESTPDSWPDEPAQTVICVQGGRFELANGTPQWGHGTRTRLRQGMGWGASFDASGPGFTGDDSLVLDRVIVGWPIAMMTRRGPEDAREAPSSRVARIWLRGIEVPVPEYPASNQKRRLPVRPIWGAFVLTSVGWGVVLAAPYGVWSGARAWRARRRAKQGRCCSCGYELDGLEQCPECGNAR